MHIVEWNDSFSVGISKIDEQHKKILELINIMQMAISADGSSELVSRTIKDLIDYTKYHFKDEEHLMRINKYIEFKDHHKIHNELIGKVDEMKDKYLESVVKDEDNSLELSSELLSFLLKWLIDHIMTTDKKYSFHIKKLK